MPAPMTRPRSLSLPLAGLGDLTPHLSRIWGSKIALITDTRELSFADLDDESTAVAAGLRARGIGEGDRVSLLSQNRWEWIVSYHGILKAGAVVNPLNVMLTGVEVAYVLRDAGSAALLTSADRWESIASHVADLDGLRLVATFDGADGTVDFADLRASDTATFTPAAADPEALACIAYTSGTTGHPKGAMQSHRSLALNTAYTATMHGRTSDDLMVTALPAAHVYGNVAINGTLLAGGTVVLMTRFDASTALALIERHGATLFEGVPAMYAMLVADPGYAAAELGSLRRCTVGGQTIAATLMEEWERRTGAPLLELWGMTEISGLGTTHSALAPNVHGSIGVALPGTEVKVAPFDEPGASCAPGQAGELMVRGPLVMMGYFNNPEATAAVVEADGWMHTGDVATADDGGHFFVVDRIKDMIITAGYNVYPAELERVLIGHEDVALVAVGRASDDHKGEVAHAYIVPRAGSDVTEESILAYARQHLAAYKVPRKVLFVGHLPTTSSGKIMRRLLTPELAAESPTA